MMMPQVRSGMNGSRINKDAAVSRIARPRLMAISSARFTAALSHEFVGKAWPLLPRNNTLIQEPALRKGRGVCLRIWLPSAGYSDRLKRWPSLIGLAQELREALIASPSHRRRDNSNGSNKNYRFD